MAARRKAAAAWTQPEGPRVDAGELRDVLRRLADVCAPRSTIPILGTVRLSAQDGLLRVAATDLDRRAEEELDMLPGSPDASAFDLAVSARDLRVAVDSAGDSVTFEPGQECLVVRHGCGWFQLPAMPVAEWPAWEPLADDVPVARLTVDGDALAEALARVAPAASSEEARYYLCGVLVEPIAAGGLKLTATDGHRLHHLQLPARWVDEQKPVVQAAIVPRATVANLRALGGEVTLELAATQVYAASGRLRLWSRVVGGTYPDYERVIPAEGSAPSSAIVDAEALTDAVRGVAPLAAEKSQLVRLNAWDEGRLRVSSASEQGSGQLLVTAEYAGPPIEIGASARYLPAAIAAVGTARVRLEVSGPAAPILILPVDGERPARAVVMPMRV